MGAQIALSGSYLLSTTRRYPPQVPHRPLSLNVAAACLASLLHHAVLAQGKVDAVTPGTIVTEPATPTSIGVRWPVVGDKNLNATVAVSYRMAGPHVWLEGYPLFRTFNDRVSPDNAVPDGHLFAGSIVDLAPDTQYEVRLSLEDPDGGSVVKTVALRTAAVPRLPAAMKRHYVVARALDEAPGGSGTAADPFRGLDVALSRAQAGDLLALGSGTYSGGPFVPQASGTYQQPIVIQGQADGSAVLDGRGGAVLIDVSGREHIWFDRLTLRNAITLLQADRASYVVATRNRFELLNYGFRSRGAAYREAVGFYISDNVFAGTSQWPRARGIEAINAIIVTGSGHVISYNLIQNVGDGVHNGNDGRLSASDIHNNDIDVCTDDGIEADYSDTNIRIFRNRITNCFAGISMQPARGGPVYVFRNLMLNLQYAPFKLHNDTAGALIFHNTSVKSGIAFNISNAGETVRDVITRNNLFVGTGSPALYSNGRMSRTDFENDGYEWSSRGAFAVWNGKTYASTIATLGAGALYSDRGAVALGPHLTFAGSFAPPQSHVRQIDRSAHDPRLAPSSRAIDRGVRLPNFNDQFVGSAPDLGCCELGHELPWFGPRPSELNR